MTWNSFQTRKLGVDEDTYKNINLANQEQVDISGKINEIKKQKILVVDDNYFNCDATKNILKKILKEAGSDIEIITGSDGADIIHLIIQDQLKGNEIKCIITDENMEYINGSGAIRIIRNLERRNKIKFVNIISVTGNEDAELSSEIIKLGAQIVLSKPLPKKLISKALKDLSII